MKEKTSALSRGIAGSKEGVKRMKYAFYTCFHPFDGFYELKNNPKRRSLTAATFFFILLVLSTILKRQFTAYLFNPNDPNTLNILYETAVTVLPFMLWCLSNWCFTSLMDGEGKLSDIYQTTGFATLPLILTNLLSIPLSIMLVQSEGSFYTVLTTIGMIWSYGLIFFGMIVVQQYTLMKSLLTALLTIVGIAVILFLSLLVFFLIQQVLGFAGEFITEFSFFIRE